MSAVAPEAGARETSDAQLAGQVARLFFDRQLSKVEIAGRLGISRFRVARLIERALADGIVRIEFRDTPGQERGLARAIEEQFGLDLCVVAATSDDGATAAARLAADVLDGLIGRGESIGIAWGSTVARVVRELPPRADPSIDVVQLAGGSSSLDPGADPGDLTRVVAERVGGRPHRIHAPVFVGSARVRAALLREPEVAATVDRFESLTLALIGIGAFAAGSAPPSSSLLRSGALAPKEVRRLVEHGAIGDLLVHPFDASGAFVAPEIAARSVAIDVDQLRHVPRVVAVAAGVEKADAIRGALRSGVVRILVTDIAAASAIQADVEAAPRRRPPGRRR